jgi:DNA-binding MarR family transcriptional regulator
MLLYRRQWVPNEQSADSCRLLSLSVRFRIILFRMDNYYAPDIVPALERATHLLGLWVERSLAELHLTQAEAHVLAYLARHSPSTINDLHRGFGHKRSTLTSLLDRLEGRGWLLRVPHPTSRRMVGVELTDAGRLAGAQVRVALDALEARLMARAGNEDIAAFFRVIQTLEEELSRDR